MIHRQTTGRIAGRLRQYALSATLALAALAPLGVDAAAQTYAQFVREANQNTVSIVSGTPGETSLEIAYDLSTVLHCVDGLRVVPMVGRGDANNIYDLLFLRGVDMAIVPADVLDHLAERDAYIGDLRNRIVYIAPLFEQEVHLLAGEEIRTVADLQGKLVNIGAPGALALAARRVLEAAGVTVIESKFDNALALERVIDGGLDAMFLVGGKPVPLFEAMRDVTGLRLVPLTPPPGADVYRAAAFTHEDYPSLVPAGETVGSIAVPSVLAAYDWDPTHERYAKNKLFTDAFFRRAGYLRRPARHPKWQVARLDATTPGWRRFQPAEDLLTAAAASATASAAELLATATIAAPDAELEQQFERQLADFGITPASAEERAQLFDAFRRRIEAENRN